MNPTRHDYASSAMNGSSGLKASIWASGRSHTHVNRSFDTRARSVPPPSNPPTFANPTPAPATAHSNATSRLAPAQALHRLEQTCLRLKWKSIDLESSYYRTLSPLEHGFEPANAERNFKVDFYEFYAWIEQALVLLQRIFGVEILPGGGMAGSSAPHAYHHNVLQALSDADNPLNGVLGKGEVNHALWKAKELRNRWKDAAAGEMETPPLRMYDLQWIVGTILKGLEECYVGAGEKVRLDQVQAGSVDDGAGGDGDEGWDWMVETMDWEA